MNIEESLFPFLYGLGAGLLICLVVLVRESMKRGVLRKEIKKLKDHLQQKLEIEAEATQNKSKEISQLKKENENLRITNQSLAQKPGRREVMNLHIYQHAISIMTEHAHGFAPMWQKALQQAEQKMEEVSAGKGSFIKKVIPLNFFKGSAGNLEDGKEEEES